MEKLLYINNYHCTDKHIDGYPDNHLWGADYLNKRFQVVCATVPKDIISNRIPYLHVINGTYKQLALLFRYFFIKNVYSACGELTDAFALANVLHIGNRKLYKITHHGNGGIRYPEGYTKILFLSNIVKNRYANLKNTQYIEWGGDTAFADRFINKPYSLDYDFISAGKTDRDYNCLIDAAQQIEGKTLIISDINDKEYDNSKVTIINGNKKSENSLNYTEVFSYYMRSRFIVIPCSIKDDRNIYTINGLTSFVDAVVAHKPVLISSTSNMGIDVEGLGIGLEYKAGDSKDLQKKMNLLLHLSEEDYSAMCDKVEIYSRSHNYTTFCKELSDIIQ